ncbi:putative signal transduction response regulator receiver domain [Janthinobacterium sp. HH01]|uniref:response regulator n=1 Tax=Janthinobacterium sp. HH01 TaxID=1198452 RepID=UPI0002AEB64D|nr:response regulator [Janthinobacterium sp. HH01]ELX13576.1 putative signal transduction response regulator receiver domain [Janthinobacterium sp. HH01]
MSRILLVDDEPNMLSALQRALRQSSALAGAQIETFTNPFDALNRICVCDFDLAISDFMMPEMSGGEFLQALKEVSPLTVRIMLSASTDFSTAMAAINEAHVFRFLSKPWQQAELEQNILQGLEHRAALLAEAGRQPAGTPTPTPQEQEAQRLEQEEPGLLHVKRAADGSIIL